MDLKSYWRVVDYHKCVCDTTESLWLLINEKGEVRGMVKREERKGRNAMDLSG